MPYLQGVQSIFGAAETVYRLSFIPTDLFYYNVHCPFFDIIEVCYKLSTGNMVIFLLYVGLYPEDDTSGQTCLI